MKLTPGGKLDNIIKYNKNSEDMFLFPMSIKTTEDMICVLGLLELCTSCLKPVYFVPVWFTVNCNNTTVRCQVEISKATIYFHHLFSIHVANSGDILVGVVESVVGENHFYENRETNIRQIMKLTPGGKLDNKFNFH
jgi:hypothetical protein